MTIPGVQNPHCRPWFSRNACWIGWRRPSGSAMPSIVVISGAFRLDSQDRARFHRLTVQQHRARPARRRVAALLVPVSPRESRMYWASRSRGSTSSSYGTPFTVILVTRHAGPHADTALVASHTLSGVVGMSM